LGFWHTGYIEFHEPDQPPVVKTPPRPSFLCNTCDAAFFSGRDLDVHEFSGHVRDRPTLVLEGREVGRTRLYVTHKTLATDWAFQSVDWVSLNGELFAPDNAAIALASKTVGFADVVAINGDVRQEFQFEFALAGASDLDGVDEALNSLIREKVWGRDSIDTFIMRGKQYASASRYLDGIANYLYGVMAREEFADLGGDPEKYESRYDSAVKILGRFDRAPAEAICGLVAFHYNQFDRAMVKTKSARVSDISRRIELLLDGKIANRSGYEDSYHSELDAALSDSTVERMLQLCAMPLDGSAGEIAADSTSDLKRERPYDQLKLRVVLAEHYLAAGQLSDARKHADELRHSPTTENWYSKFGNRLGEVS
jgi:hypothetical protein